MSVDHTLWRPCPDHSDTVSPIEFYVSSVTGNTRRVSDRLEEELLRLGYRKVSPGSPSSVKKSSSAGTVILCFWCRKAAPDPASLAVLTHLSGRKILAFGTMGYYPEGEYGDLVRANTVSAIEAAGSTCPGVFLCQGKIPEERTEKRRALPPTDRHYLDDAGYARHLESRSHPNEQDLQNAADFLRIHADDLL